jgi:hypothetical protein
MQNVLPALCLIAGQRNCLRFSATTLGVMPVATVAVVSIDYGHIAAAVVGDVNLIRNLVDGYGEWFVPAGTMAITVSDPP